MLDLKKYFTIGGKIQINHIDARGHLNEYTSQVVELSGDDFVHVLIPIKKNQDVYLNKGTILKLIVVKDDAVYEFKTVLYDKLFGKVPLLKLKVFPEVNKIQRRNFYRLKIMKEISARLVEDIKTRKYGERFKCNMLDISAGGLLFISKMEFKEKDLLEFSLNLNGTKLIVYGTIVRKTFTSSYKEPYAYGVKFERISEFETNLITKFIFEEQRKLIKKGLM